MVLILRSIQDSILKIGLDVGVGPITHFYGYLSSGTGALNPPFKIGGQSIQWLGYQARGSISKHEIMIIDFYVTLDTSNKRNK